MPPVQEKDIAHINADRRKKNMVVNCNMHTCPFNEYHKKQCRIHPQIKKQIIGFRGRPVAICQSYKERIESET
jgi:hypothetical protein